MAEQLKRMKQSQTAKAQSLTQWRASRLHEMDLPSGLQVTLRDVTMTDLMLTGKLPASFIDLAQDAATQGDTLDLKELVKNGAEFRSMLDALIEIALVIPLLGEHADESHITLAELPNDDKMAIFIFVNREVEQIKSFREGQDKPVETV